MHNINADVLNEISNTSLQAQTMVRASHEAAWFAASQRVKCIESGAHGQRRWLGV